MEEFFKGIIKVSITMYNVQCVSVHIRFHTKNLKVFTTAVVLLLRFISYSKLYVCGRQEICFFPSNSGSYFAENNTLPDLIIIKQNTKF